MTEFLGGWKGAGVPSFGSFPPSPVDVDSAAMLAAWGVGRSQRGPRRRGLGCGAAASL